MIEYITIDGNETPLSICATTTTRTHGRLSWLKHAKETGRIGKKYHVASEELIFFDDEPAISIAAQLTEWVNTNIPKGRQFIYVPGDILMYCAELHIHNDYALVDSERLLSFEEALQQIRQEPLISHIHASGDLKKPLEQNGIELKDLHIDLTPGSKNPYWLRRGRSLNELSIAASVLLGALAISAMIFQGPGAPENEVALESFNPISVPDSFVQLHHELDELIALMSASSVWMNYGLERITITKSGADYRTRLEGEYQNHYPLPRLRELASAIGSQFTIKGEKWLVETPIYKPEPGAPQELTDILDSVEDYQRLVKGGYVELDLGTITDEIEHKMTKLELRVDRPFPVLLAGIARQVERHHIHGATQKIDVKVVPGNGWQLLSIDINLLGI